MIFGLRNIKSNERVKHFFFIGFVLSFHSGDKTIPTKCFVSHHPVSCRSVGQKKPAKIVFQFTFAY